MMLRLAALACLVGCDKGAPAPPAPKCGDPHQLVLRLGRTGCYGTCPSYEIEVFRDGRVEYTGGDFVKTKGVAHGHVEPAQIAALDALFASSHFTSLDNHYDRYDATDNPSALVLYAPPAGGAKLVTHYHGDSSSPKALFELEDGIDRVVGIEKFIGTESERDQR